MPQCAPGKFGNALSASRKQRYEHQACGIANPTGAVLVNRSAKLRKRDYIAGLNHCVRQRDRFIDAHPRKDARHEQRCDLRLIRVTMHTVLHNGAPIFGRQFPPEALMLDKQSHIIFRHATGFRAKPSEVRRVHVAIGHVVLQPLSRTPLDAISVAIYFSVFVLLTIVTYRRPAFGVAGLILIEPFALYRDIGSTTLTLPKFALAAVCIALLLRRAPLRALLDPPVRSLVLALIAVTVMTAASYFEADFKGPVFTETLKSIEYLMVFSAAFLCYRMDPNDRVVRMSCFAIAAIVSILALSQEFTFAPAGMWIAGQPVPRIAGPLEGPNQLSAYLGILLPVLVAFAVSSRPKLSELTVLCVVILAELLTLSRAGVIATLAAVGTTLFVMRGRNVRVYAIGLVVPVVFGLAAVVLVGGEISHFWSTEPQFQEVSHLGTRGQLWEAAYRLWRAHPMLGIGAGNYELELGRAGFPGIRTHANSAYIQAAVEGGLPLLVSVLAQTWFSIRLFMRRGKSPLIAAALGASTGMALHQIVDCLLFYPKVGVLFWVLIAVSVGALSFEGERADGEPT